MKKIILLFTFLLLSTVGYSQLALEGFESTTGPNPLPSTNWTLGTGNWAVFDNGIGLGQRWGINTANVCVGTQIAYANREFIGQGNTSEDYLATPLVTIPTNGELHFLTKSFTSGNQGTIYQIRVAPATATQTNPAAYTLVQQWTETELNAVYNVCEEKIVNLSAYAGQQIYVSFVMIFTQPTASLGGDRWLVDNVSINEQCLVPTGLTSTGITFNGATLNWANPSGATSWEIEIIPAAATATGTGVVYNGTLPYVVTGLLPNTAYKYYVRALCSTGYSSVWSVVSATFTTSTAPPVCGGNYVDAAGPTANYANSSDSTVTICPVTTGDVVTVTFTAFDTETNWDAIYVFNGNSITAPQIASANPAGNVPGGLAGGYWGTTIPGPFTSTSPDGCLTFRFRSDGSVNRAGWIANVTCAPPPTCVQPTSLTSSAITSNSVTLGWTNNGIATAWQVLALPCGSPAPTATTTGWIDAPTNPFNITGLNSYTCYNLYVRGVCSPTDSSFWSGPRIITTLLAPPACGGNYVDAGGPTANYVNNANSTTTVCPVNAGDSVTITFSSFNLQANFDFLKIYNGNDATAPLLANLTGTALPPSFTSSATNGCLTFVFTSNASVTAAGWLANLSCAPTPTCPQPVLLTSSNITATTATFGWATTGTETAWQVLALPCTAPPPTAATTGWIDTITNPVNITGLTPITCYNLYVRAACSATNVSTWSGPISFTTPIAPPVCGGMFVDAAGPTANYPNSSDSTVTICPTNPGDVVTVTFTSFNTETNWDGLYVFDGNSITAPQIASANPAGNVPGGLAGSYWGTVIPGPFTSSSPNGCLTFRFRSDGSVNNPGWIADITCTLAPTCPRPTAVLFSNQSQTGATIAWTEVGSATTWEVFIVPVGSPLPNASSVGIITSTNPYVATGLNSGTAYTAYVRAICSATDISTWSYGYNFFTLIANDECINAVSVPVNPDTLCGQVVGGSLIGATASTQPNACTGTSDDDVWFSFVANATTHTINLNNITGSTTNLRHVLYSGACGAFTQLACNATNQSVANNLIVGQTYYIRVYSFTATPNQTSTFNVCVGTIPPPISTNTNQYTTLQLIQDILLNSTCASVTNVTSSTGTNFGSTNGIGYFNQNGSGFPFSDGVVLTTGNAASAQGPNTTLLSDGATTWTGDPQLEAIILAATGTPMTSRNATKLEFDFVPLVNNISFNFIFASEEYGTFQCTFSDSFAFLLTNVATGITTNLAVIPNTTTPVSVVTIRNSLYNAGCASVNPQYFANFFGAGGQNPLGSPTNFNGITVPLTATSPVIPGNQYHIKLVIADQGDTAYDSAVFLEGGSLDIGNVELGNDFLESNGNALCFGSSYTIQSGLNPAQYTFTWTFNGNKIPNETGANLVITQEGVYGIAAQYTGTTCAATDTITIEYYPSITIGTPNNLIACNNTGFAEFDLTQNNAVVLANLDPSLYTIAYYLSNADALAESNALPNPYTNVIQSLQTVYVRLENITTTCFAISQFNLIVNPLVVPTFAFGTSITSCEIPNSTPVVLPTTSENGIAGTWNPSTIDYTVVATTTHTFTPNIGTCGSDVTLTVTVNPNVLPTFTFGTTLTICSGGSVPTLPTASENSINGTWSPAVVSNTQSGNYTFTPTVGLCALTTSFDVVVIPNVTPTFNSFDTLCYNGVRPLLPSVSNENITGTWLPPIVNNTSTQNYTFTPDSGQCAVSTSISIEVLSDVNFEVFGECLSNSFTAQVINTNFDESVVNYDWENSNGDSVGTNNSTFNVTEYVNSTTVEETMPISFTVTVTTPDGCFKTVPYTANQIFCQIQKGISPNNDGNNDEFDLSALGVKKLSIYNRYGLAVYSKTNYNNEWFGQTDKGEELPDGTYYFVIELDNGDATKTGWIYINRESN